MAKGSIRDMRGNASPGTGKSVHTQSQEAPQSGDIPDPSQLSAQQRAQFESMQSQLRVMKGQDPAQLTQKLQQMMAQNPTQARAQMQQFMSSVGPMLNSKQKEMLQRLMK